MFLIKMPIAEQKLIYQTDKSSYRRSSINKAVHKNFAVFTRKQMKLQFVRPATLLKKDSNIDVFL